MAAAQPIRRQALRTTREARAGLAPNPSWFDRTYQTRFITNIFLIIMTLVLASSCVAVALLWKTLYQPGAGQQVTLSAALIGVAVAMITELILAAPIAYYLGLRQTNRVVGPLRRMIRTIEAIGSGDFSRRITLRQGDVLEMVARSINQMAEQLQKRYGNSHSA